MTKAAAELKEGEKVAWNWGAGQPTGTVKKVVEGDASVTTNKGNEVTRKGDEKDPAVVLEADSGNQAIKSAHELVGVETNDKAGSGKKPASKGGKSGGEKPASKGKPASKASEKPATKGKPASKGAESKAKDDSKAKTAGDESADKKKKAPAKPKKETAAPTRSAPKRAAATKGAAKTSKHASGDNEPDNVDEDEAERPKKKAKSKK